MSISGLTSAEAQTRLSKHGPNSLPSDVAPSFFALAWRVIREPMLILLIAAGIINFALASFLDASLLMFTVVIVLVISIFQEKRTERALQSLRELAAPLALVLRDGEERRISSETVVIDDLLILQEGDRIPADATVISLSNLTCDESLLTGESLPVSKSVGDRVFAGSLVTRGHGRARVTAIGSGTEIGKIGTSIRDIPFERTRLQSDVDRLVKVIGVLGFITVALIITIFGVTRHDWLQGALAGIAAAMALIPEEFPVILTLFLAIGARRLSKSRVIARKVAAIEALGSVSALCVDKTGTLTMNQMSVAEFHIDGFSEAITDAPLSERSIRMAQIAGLAGPLAGFDPMDRAFQSLAALYEIDDKRESIEEFPVIEGRLAYIHIWKINGSFLAAAKGAPETIATLCKLDEAQIQRIENETRAAGNRGYRVLAIAQANLGENAPRIGAIEEISFTFLGLAFLHDPIRPGVREAISECRGAGIRTIMITGDHPNTARAIAREIGLDNPDICLTGLEIDAMSEAELADAIRTNSIFARVSPQHKLQIVRALRSDGFIVGMTGDGVNDAPALRAADIGIAMGGRGTDVAREASALIITDDNFTSIVEGVRRGRGIFSNLQKSMSYVIAVHVPIFGMAVVPLLDKNWPLILLPALVAFHEIIIDPACSIVFEEEPIDPEVMKDLPRPVDSHLLSWSKITAPLLQGIAVLLGVFALFLYGQHISLSPESTRSLCFATLMSSNLFLLFVNRSRSLTIFRTFRERKNPTVPWIIAAVVIIVFTLTAIPGLRTVFDMGSLTVSQYLLAIITSYVCVGWYDLWKKFH